MSKFGDLRDILLIAIGAAVVIALALSGTLDHDGVKTLAGVLVGIIGGAVTMAPKPSGA